MTTKTKMSNLEAFQELSIQIACLDMKLNKILELLNTPEVEYQIVNNISISDLEKFDEEFK